MSTFGSVDFLTSALRAQSLAQAIINQNIANAATSGYSREVAVLAGEPFVNLPSFDSAFSPAQVGQGVRLQTIERIRDQFLDLQIRAQLSAQGEHDALSSASASVALLFPEIAATPGTGLVSAVAKLFTDFAAVGAAPGSAAARATLVADAQNLTGLFHAAAQTLEGLQATLDGNVRSDLGVVNGLLQRIASDNATVARAQSSGAFPVGTVEDDRDAAISELAKYVNVTTATLSDGSVMVMTGNARTLVRGDTASILSPLTGPHVAAFADIGLQEAPGGPVIDLTGELGSGELKGLVEARDGTVANARLSLDELAHSLIAQVNLLHQAGYAQDGVTTNTAFFATGGGAGNDAADISVNAAIVANPSLVAASGLAGNGADGSQAVSLGELGGLVMNAFVQSTGAVNNLVGLIDPSQALASAVHSALNGPNPLANNASDFLVPPSAGGTIVINGVAVAWTNADSIQAIVAKINNPGLGLGVVASWDQTKQRLSLLSQGPLTVYDQAGNLTAALRLESRVTSLAAVNNGIGPLDNPVVITSPLSASIAQYRTDVLGSGGTLTVDGISVAWTAGQSLLTIRNNLNAALAPAGLTVSFSAATQQVTLTGSVGLPATAANPIRAAVITDTAGTLSLALNLDAQPTFAAFTAGLLGQVQAQRDNTAAVAATDAAVAGQLQAQQDALSKVNLNQEQQSLLESSMAYQAAVQAMAIMDSTLNTLINRMAVTTPGQPTASVLNA